MNGKMCEKYAKIRHQSIKKTAVFSLLIIIAFCGSSCRNIKKPAETDMPPAPKDTIAVEKPPKNVIDIEDEPREDEDKGYEEDDTLYNEESTDGVTEDDMKKDAETDLKDRFYAEEISDEVFSRMEGRSFPADCAVPREDLMYLHLLYKDIDSNTHEGEMVCNRQIADKLTEIFRKLYEADYPIEHMSLIDNYEADDDVSMSANNTSCFNYRVVKGTNKISRHGYGLAVDINPRYNPYVHTVSGETVIEPENGAQYADRSADFDYKIDEDDLAYKLFTEAGFTWGGSWKNSKDYQHFQID